MQWLFKNLKATNPVTLMVMLQNNNESIQSQLTHFSSMFHFYTPKKCQTFSGSIEMEHWAKWVNTKESPGVDPLKRCF